MVGYHLLGNPVQMHGSPVVAQPGPVADHLTPRSRGQRSNRGKRSQKRRVLRHYPVHLRLLEHHLGD